MTTDLESADMAHFTVEASESYESGAFTPERARGLTFCYYFRRRRFVLTYFGSRDCWGTEHQCKWNLLLPACWISRISRHMMQLGKKMTRCHMYCSFMHTVIVLSAISKLIWTHHYSIFAMLVVFRERLLNQWPYISLNSWQQPAWFTYKPYINLLSIANDSDHTVTWMRHLLDRKLSKIPVILSTAQPTHYHQLCLFFFFYKALALLHTVVLWHRKMRILFLLRFVILMGHNARLSSTVIVILAGLAVAKKYYIYIKMLHFMNLHCSTLGSTKANVGTLT